MAMDSGSGDPTEYPIDLSEESSARRVIAEFSDAPLRSYTLVELAEETGLGEEQVENELDKLETEGLVRSEASQWRLIEHKFASLVASIEGIQSASASFPDYYAKVDNWDEGLPDLSENYEDESDIG